MLYTELPLKDCLEDAAGTEHGSLPSHRAGLPGAHNSSDPEYAIAAIVIQ